MRDNYYALFVGISADLHGLQIIPSVSCAIMRARYPTVSSHPTGIKHDFIILSLSETVTTEQFT